MTGSARSLLTLLILPLLAAACSTPGASPTVASPPSSTLPPPSASPTPQPATRAATTASANLVPCDVSGAWRIQLDLTGGFAGVERKLELDEAGAYEARDVQTGREVRGQAPSDLMEETRAGLPTLCQSSGSGRPPPCPDCFQYGVETAVAGSEFDVVLNDGNLMDNPAGPLVATLAAFLNEVLQP